jgi:hypothetical protein
MTNWKYYYNIENTELIRANLVYTPLVSPDEKTFCMSFNRDIKYHWTDNEPWTDDLLEDRFRKELKFHKLASTAMPTLDIIDVDETNRKIFFKWYGDDFYMLGVRNGGYDNVLPDWQEQWVDLIKKMQNIGIYKISLHPNSWAVNNGVLIPFNWFFCFEENDPPVTVRSHLMQISPGRQEKLAGVELDKFYNAKELQYIAFHSFRSNYPSDLIDTILTTINL